LQIGDKDQGKEVLDLENLNKRKDILEDVEILKSPFLFERAIHSLNFDISYYSRGKILTMERYKQSPIEIEVIKLKDSSLCQLPIYIRQGENNLTMNYTNGNKERSFVFHENQLLVNSDFSIRILHIDKAALLRDLEYNDFYFEFNNLKNISNQLIGNLSVELINPEAKTIQISYTSNNPNLCVDISRAVYMSYFKYDEEKMKASSEKVLSFINQQLDSIKLRVSRSKDSIELFQLKEQLPNPEAQSARILEQISMISDQKYAVETDLQKLNLVDRKIQSNPKSTEVYQLIPELIGSSFESTISSQIKNLYELIEKKADLAYSMTENSSEYKLIIAKVNQKIESIRQLVGAIKMRLITQLGIYNQKLNEFQQEYVSIPSKQMELSRLESIQELNSKYYDLLMDKKTIYQISNEGYSSKNIVLQDASMPRTPIWPISNFIYSIVFFLALFFSMALFILFYLTYNEINSVQDLENLLNHAIILGTIPKHSAPSIYSQLLVVQEPKSTLAEAFRNIRTNLQFVSPGARIFSVSSSISGEGKTFVCLNLAGIIALSGKRVVLIDLDLRKPKIHFGFQVDNKEGMSNVLIGKSKLEDCIQKTSLNTLDFISAGATPPNPSELIMSEQMMQVLEKLKELYDIVVIDNPPIGLVSDGMSMMIKADCPIYIFKANYSKRNFALRLKELHDVQKISKINVILNAIKPNKRGYGYGYGYGYGNYEESKSPTLWQKLFKRK
jgi:capsular exopolysaccharide synthesis family protein